MTLASPDNQIKTRAMLQQHSRLVSKLLSIPRELPGEAGQSVSNPISAYEYAWFFDDKAM